MQAGRAIVIGGSMGGLLIGNMLVRRGWQISVHERVADDLATRGAGIARHAEMDPIMAEAGVPYASTVGIPVHGRTAYDTTGRVIARYDFPQHLSPWASAYNPLHAAFPPECYHRGQELTGIEQHASGVTAHFAGGATATGDLLVGADGFRSTVRAIVSPDVVPRYCGYVAWRGHVAEPALSAEFKAETFERFAFCFTPGGQFIGYPVYGPGDNAELGQRQYNYLWYCHVDAGWALDRLLTDEKGGRHRHSIPPPLIHRDAIEGLRDSARAHLPPPFAEAVLKSAGHMLQPIYDVESPRIAFGRIALLGDAAFVARPHVGIGVLKAGQDALALADSLNQAPDVFSALARYQAIRVPCGQEAVRLGRYLGAFIERDLPGPCSDPSLELGPERIIRISARSIEQLACDPTEQAARGPAAPIWQNAARFGRTLHGMEAAAE